LEVEGVGGRYLYDYIHIYLRFLAEAGPPAPDRQRHPLPGPHPESQVDIW
jgi:hypothetical protein